VSLAQLKEKFCAVEYSGKNMIKAQLTNPTPANFSHFITIIHWSYN
jgi:hypothetical protein